MTRYVLDTQLYVEAARNPARAEELAKFTSASLPSIFLHSVVVQEILAGAVGEERKRQAERTLVQPFERRGRLVVPGYGAWKRSGEVVAELVARRDISPGSFPPSFMNDVLLTCSCRDRGLTLVTRNMRDFQLIARVEPVRFVEPWPSG